MGILLQRYLNKIFDSLIAQGYRIMKNAAKNNDTMARTYNMDDAYATAVYYQGKRVRTRYLNPTPESTEIHKGWKKHHIQAGRGRGYLETFFGNFKPTTDGISLIVVNVIYYTSILEQGKQTPNGGRHYKIISSISADMTELEEKIKGSRIAGIGIKRGRTVR